VDRKITGAIERDPREGICDHPDCENKIPSNRRTFCSDACGTLFFYENNWAGIRRIVWLRDQGKCKKCNSEVVFYEDGYYYSCVKLLQFEEWEPPEYRQKIRHKYLSNDILVYIHVGHLIEKLWDGNEKWCYGDCVDTKKAEIDHILAVGLGGAHLDIDNLQTLCHDCHMKKTKIDRKKMAIQNQEKKSNYLGDANDIQFTEQTELEEFF